MDQPKRQHLIKTLNSHGMTVLLTRDHDAIMLELAILRRFECRIRAAAAVDTPLQMVVKGIVVTRLICGSCCSNRPNVGHPHAYSVRGACWDDAV